MDRNTQPSFKPNTFIGYQDNWKKQMFHHRPAYSAPPGQNTVYRPRARFPSSQQASVNSCGNTLQHYGNPLGQYSPRPSSPLSKQQQQSVVEKVKILVNENRSSLDNTDCPSGHLLQDTWTFWYLRLQDNFSWEKSQLPIGSCSSVEQFWSIYDQIVSLAEAPSGCNYSLFKKGIRPVWEDPMNQHGGRLVFTIKKDKLDYKLFVEKMWFEFSMAVVGNVLPDVSEQICGICGANRNQMVKIAIWTRERKKHEEIRQIGLYFKKLIDYKQPVPYEANINVNTKLGSVHSQTKILFEV